MSACALDRGEETRGRRGDVGGGQRLWHYVAWNIYSCLIHETQSPPRVTMVATFSLLCIALYYVVCVCVWRKMIDSLTRANHLCACLLYALSFWISLYGRCCFLAARTTQLFCLSLHSACPLSFSFGLSTIDSETQGGSFPYFVMRFNLRSVYFAGVYGVHCKSQFEWEDTNWRESSLRTDVRNSYDLGQFGGLKWMKFKMQGGALLSAAGRSCSTVTLVHAAARFLALSDAHAYADKHACSLDTVPRLS